MIFGMTIFTFIHVLLSLVGIASGFVLVAALLRSEQAGGWAAIFLASTVATSLTGFGFPLSPFLPSHGLGIISLVVLAAVILARYALRLTGPWRLVYVIGAMTALYFNVFVLVVQAFRKIPALHTLAPTESEAPFAIAQGAVFVAFVILTIAAVRAFRPATLDAA